MPDRPHHMHLVRQEKFLKSFARYGVVKTAARAAGVDRSTVWRWRDGDPAFAEAFALAAQEAVDVLEQAAWRRATEGVVQADGTKKPSDALLVFLLKARDPGRFAETQRVALSAKGQVDIDARLTVAAEEPGTEHLSPEELDRLTRVVLGDFGAAGGALDGAGWGSTDGHDPDDPADPTDDGPRPGR